eukprot:gi/632949801/ref/XP_007890363.1/ PREDICTED: interleukin-6 receptor subunit beta-like isoform X2 [Callorhinchus milii]
MFLLHTYGCEVGLGMTCHDFDSPSEVQLGSNLTMSCSLREKCFDKFEANASHIFWIVNGVRASQEQYRAINASVSLLSLRNFNVPRSEVECEIDSKGKLLTLHIFIVKAGSPPDKPKNVSCIAYFRKNFTCFWDRGRETDLETNFTVTKQLSTRKPYTCNTLKSNSCSFMFPHLYSKGQLMISVTAQNALGKAQSDPLYLDVSHILKPASPKNVAVQPCKDQKRCLLITWQTPRSSTPVNFPLKYNIKYRMVDTESWTQVAVDGNSSGTSLMLKNLKPLSNYTVAVRCIGSKRQFYWSEWSSEETGTASGANPSKGPDIWRQIQDSSSQGKRNVHLLLKALDKSEANGIILGYKIWIEKQNGEPVIQEDYNTSLNYSFLLTHEVHIITVIAYNSAGDSPNSTLIIPAVNQTDPPPVQHVRIIPQNDQFLLEWKNPKRPGNGFVIEWCLALDTKLCSGMLHWQHERNSSETAFIQRDIMPFKCYIITLFALYDEGPGRLFSGLAYLEQKPPKEGPHVRFQNVKAKEATIKWDEIPLDSQFGFITNYTIFYKSNNSENSVTVNSSFREYTLRSLQKNTMYTVLVMASTVKGGKNSSTIFFNTILFEIQDIMAIVVPLFCIIIIFILLIGCYKKSIVKVIWPNVPDPAESSMAGWLPDSQLQKNQFPKILDPETVVNSDFSTLEVFCLHAKTKQYDLWNDDALNQHLMEGPSTTSSSQESTPNDKIRGGGQLEQDILDTVMYTIFEDGYKSQTPVTSSSMSNQPLLSHSLEGSRNDQETGINCWQAAPGNGCPQYVQISDMFQEIIQTNPYLKSSMKPMTIQNLQSLESLVADPSFDENHEVIKAISKDSGSLDPQQQNSQLDDIDWSYITLELLEHELNNLT